MVDPAFALLVFGVFVAVAAALAWPRWGLMARLSRMANLRERVLLEDALKHIYTCESMGRDSSLESLAGQLELSTGKAAELLGILAAAQLNAQT